MKHLAGWALVIGCLAGCGDNSKQCGEGTSDEDGDNICEPDGSPGLICGDGTVLDELTLECVPDPSVCGGGTVLINGTCQDPTGGLVVDLEEGPEPNGFDPGATLAGTITLKPQGEGFVLHGCVAPVDNNSPDLDVYQLDVAGPTLLHIAADGVQGLAAGFIVFGDDPSLSSWFRLGINISTDTSKREVFLPVAGRYQFVMTDTRTLLPITQNGEGFPAAGNPDGTSCYYVTLTQRPIPTPATLNLATGATGTIGEDLKFFTASFPTGFIGLEAVIDPEDLDGDGIPDLDSLGNQIDSRAASSLVVLNNNAIRQINDADADSPISDAFFGGIKQGDNPIVVLDYVWNYAIGPADFELQAPIQTTSQALSTSGGTVDDTSNGQFFALAGEPFFENVNLFHFDVGANGEIDTMDIAFSIPVQGSILDQDGGFVSPLTGVVSSGIETFTAYQGLFRAFSPGRHYFFVFAPRNPVDTAFTVTSTIAAVTPTNIINDTPTAPISFNAVKSNIFRHVGGDEPWHTFNAHADASVGAVTAEFFDPAVRTPQTPGFAFGRLDPLITTRNNQPPSARLGDGTPIFKPLFQADGSTPLHAILRNPFAAVPKAATTLLVKVNPTVASPAGQFVMDFSSRVYDGGVLAAGQELDANRTMTAGSEERFYVETAPGNRVVIDVAVSNEPNLDVVIEQLDAGENVIQTANQSGPDAGEGMLVAQNLSGFTAFRVRGADGTSAGTYSVKVQAVAGNYTAAQQTAVFADACSGGSVVPLTADVLGPADDEGLSAPIAAPAGFELHGQAVTEFVVSSNGFLSFNTSITEALFESTPLAATPDVSIAPHWDDLFGVSVCTKVIGTKRILQWEGFDIETNAPVQFQAILDANGTIEFAYGPTHFATGRFATIGAQFDSDHVTSLGVDIPVESPNTSIKLTPN